MATDGKETSYLLLIIRKYQAGVREEAVVGKTGEFLQKQYVIEEIKLLQENNQLESEK